MKKFLNWGIPVIVVLATVTGISRADQTSLSPKAYKTMEETYRNRAAGNKPARPIYICPMCGMKAKVPGDCPRCGMEMVRDRKESKAVVELPYRCGHCGLQSAELGNCPRCGRELKKKMSVKPTAKNSCVCPMCHIKSDKPGKCPQCGMDMVKEKAAPQKTAPKESKPQASVKPALKDGYVCPMCDVKSDKPGKCPHCGMEMVKDVPKDPNAKVVYRCDRCGIESDKPGDCPHHCGGTLVIKE